jgi:hypothetical protein
MGDVQPVGQTSPAAESATTLSRAKAVLKCCSGAVGTDLLTWQGGCSSIRKRPKGDSGPGTANMRRRSPYRDMAPSWPPGSALLCSRLTREVSWLGRRGAKWGALPT